MKFDDFQETITPGHVLKYLDGRGFAINRMTFYNHVKAGKLRKNQDGVFTRRMVEEYVGFWIKPKQWPGTKSTGSDNDSEEAILAKRKLKAEVLKLEAQAKRAAYEFDTLRDKYISREQVARELAGRAVILACGYQQMVETNIGKLVEAVAGNPARIESMKAIILEAQNELLNNYANDLSFLDEITE